MIEKHVDMTERLQEMGETVSEFKDLITHDFKDMHVELKEWHFNVGNVEKEYIVEAHVKLVISPKNVVESTSKRALISEEETNGKIEKTKGKIQEEVGKAERKVKE